jgi:hypothetical protein
MKKPELEQDEKTARHDKGRDERGIGERLGRVDRSGSNHPQTKETGIKSESNVGEDETSGDG